MLIDRNIQSVYHHYTKEEQGKESSKTFYLQRNINKGYHIDYCFLPKELLDQLSTFELGDLDYWLSISDHLPLFVSFGNVT